MNRYDKEIIKNTDDKATILCLRQVNKMTIKEHIFDMMFDEALSIKKGFEVNGEYYLTFMNDQNIELVHMDKDFRIEKFDLSEKIKDPNKIKSFAFLDKKFKVVRKVK